VPALVKGQLAGLSESAATETTHEGFFAAVEVFVLRQVLVTGKTALAQVTHEPFAVGMVGIDVPLEVKFGVVDLVAARSHAAVQQDEVFGHYYEDIRKQGMAYFDILPGLNGPYLSWIASFRLRLDSKLQYIELYPTEMLS